MTTTTIALGSKIRGLAQLMRPKQWVKNGFVFAPLLFTGQFVHWHAITSAVVAALLFCVASSAAYIVNDLHDLDRDRRHPKKSKSRPIAAGTVSSSSAMILLSVLYGLLVVGWVYVPDVTYLILAYSILNLAYTFVLKHQPVLDIFTIAIGFVLRVVVGAEALQVPVSSWTFVTTLCLALYLAAVKRRQELSQSGTEAREVLEKYTVSLVDRYAEMSATGALLFYSMFVMSAQPGLIPTIPLVLFGLFRYWYVVEALDGGESPTDALLSDWQLLATVVAWVAVCLWVLWPAKG